jgi:hypothetical protein
MLKWTEFFKIQIELFASSKMIRIDFFPPVSIDFIRPNQGIKVLY